MLTLALEFFRSALRNWLFQVSKDGFSWTTLFSHNDDCSLSEPGSTASWPLEAKGNEAIGWRHVRLQQTGKNASGQTHYLSLSGFELYGTVTGICEDLGRSLKIAKVTWFFIFGFCLILMGSDPQGRRWKKLKQLFGGREGWSEPSSLSNWLSVQESFVESTGSGAIKTAIPPDLVLLLANCIMVSPYAYFSLFSNISTPRFNCYFFLQYWILEVNPLTFFFAISCINVNRFFLFNY